MHLPDLTRLAASESLVGVDSVAVGWLDRGYEYTKGDVEPEVFGKLADLSQAPWNPVVAGGFHACSLCRFSQGPRGNLQVFVPGPSALFVSPQLIVHYIVAHDYSPPPEYRQAVLACPPMRSMAYLRELRRCGVRFAAPGTT